MGGCNGQQIRSVVPVLAQSAGDRVVQDHQVVTDRCRALDRVQGPRTQIAKFGVRRRADLILLCYQRRSVGT